MNNKNVILPALLVLVVAAYFGGFFTRKKTPVIDFKKQEWQVDSLLRVLDSLEYLYESAEVKARQQSAISARIAGELDSQRKETNKYKSLYYESRPINEASLGYVDSLWSSLLERANNQP